MILIVDNYDSFTYNLAQYFGELGCALMVKRNDAISLDEISSLRPTHVCISPGPGRPEQAGLSNDIVREFSARVPLLGVCLGHQCIGEVFGGKIVAAPRLLHGKTSQIQHNGGGVFANLPNPFTATRYHSLIVSPDSVPDCLEVTAQTSEGEIMGLRHRVWPVHGVQFHPESILTGEGRRILRNFLDGRAD